jgi:type I restriction enzyme S subunit
VSKVKVKLGDICKIQSGGTPSRSKDNYWNNGTIPWVKIKDFKDKYINNTEEFITEEGLKNSSAKMVKKGSILFTIFATLGEVAILNIDATTNQAIASINIVDERIERDYLYYYLKSIKNKILGEVLLKII